MRYTINGLIITVILLIGGCCFTGCDVETKKPSADQQQTQQTERAMQEANRQVGMPAIVNFQERKLMKMILELRDQEDFVCHAYLVNEINGEIGQYLGKCLGYGLPYSVQYTNPDRIVNGYMEVRGGSFSGESYVTISQPDPNGLFMPEGLSATWLMLVDPETNEPRPVYVEPSIIVSPFPLH